MAQNTLAETPFNRPIRDWISQHRNSINKVAEITGLPAAAIALAPGEEASHIIYESVSPGFGLAFPWVHENIKDYGQDWLARHAYSHGRLAKDFQDREAEIRAGLSPNKGVISQAWDHPTSMDVGWGNVNVGSAIQTLKEYLDQTGPGGKYAGDPFGWREKYASNYSQFVADLTDRNSPLTFQMAGVLLGDIDRAYENAYQGQYTSLPENERAAFLVTGYKQGINKINGFIDRKLQGLSPGQLPPISNPQEGDGGPAALRNYPTIRDILSGRTRGSADDQPFGDNPLVFNTQTSASPASQQSSTQDTRMSGIPQNAEYAGPMPPIIRAGLDVWPTTLEPPPRAASSFSGSTLPQPPQQPPRQGDGSDAIAPMSWTPSSKLLETFMRKRWNLTDNPPPPNTRDGLLWYRFNLLPASDGAASGDVAPDAIGDGIGVGQGAFDPRNLAYGTGLGSAAPASQPQFDAGDKPRGILGWLTPDPRDAVTQGLSPPPDKAGNQGISGWPDMTIPGLAYILGRQFGGSR